MNKFLLVASLLVTTVALNAGPGCSSCPGSKTVTRTSSCPSGACGERKPVVKQTPVEVEEEVVVTEEEEAE